MASQAQRYLEKLDIGYSYRLAKRMEGYRTNPVLGYRTAGSPAEIATGDMLASEMKKIGFSKVWKDAITVDAWEFEKAELSFTDAEGQERRVQLGRIRRISSRTAPQPTSWSMRARGRKRITRGWTSPASWCWWRSTNATNGGSTTPCIRRTSRARRR